MTDADKDAVIDRAARALHDLRGGASPDAAQTRARVLATRARDRQRTMVAIAAAAMLAIGLGVPTAWAWSTGRLERWIGGEPAPEPQPSPREQPAPRETPRPVEEPAPVPVPVPVPESLPAEPEPISAPIAPDPIEEEPAVDPAERRAYREAHALHFDARDPSGALAAWDRYLAEYPSGRFAIEARYNRALCLVRLDRPSDAREALAPFAEGRHGEYRRREASALIEALGE